MINESTQPLYRKHALVKLAIGLGAILFGLLSTDSSTNLRIFFGLMGFVHLLEVSVRYLGSHQRNLFRLLELIGWCCWFVALIFVILEWFKITL